MQIVTVKPGIFYRRRNATCSPIDECQERLVTQRGKDLHILLVSPYDRIIFTMLIRLSLIYAPGSRMAH